MAAGQLGVARRAGGGLEGLGAGLAEGEGGELALARDQARGGPVEIQAGVALKRGPRGGRRGVGSEGVLRGLGGGGDGAAAFGGRVAAVGAAALVVDVDVEVAVVVTARPAAGVVGVGDPAPGQRPQRARA